MSSSSTAPPDPLNLATGGNKRQKKSSTETSRNFNAKQRDIQLELMRRLKILFVLDDSATAPDIVVNPDDYNADSICIGFNQFLDASTYHEKDFLQVHRLHLTGEGALDAEEGEEPIIADNSMKLMLQSFFPSPRHKSYINMEQEEFVPAISLNSPQFHLLLDQFKQHLHMKVWTLSYHLRIVMMMKRMKRMMMLSGWFNVI